MSRNEQNQAAPYGPDKTKYYMELNAPKWKDTIMQGDLRPAFFADVVTQDNIGSPINKASANFDDHSNARFLRWLWRRCTVRFVRTLPASPLTFLTFPSNLLTSSKLSHVVTHAQASAEVNPPKPCGPELQSTLLNATFNIRSAKTALMTRFLYCFAPF